MRFRILNFKKTEKRLEHEIQGELLKTPDYFQFYINGIEQFVNEKDFILIDRFDNERSEVIAYNFYDDENISDVLVLCNNDNYIWDAPADFDLVYDIVDNKMNYYKSQRQISMSDDEFIYWRDKLILKAYETHKAQKNYAVPLRSEVQKVIRKINDYKEEREVI